MPVKSGVEATVEIRHAQGDPPKNIPIVAVTADTSRENRHACEKAGINVFLEKPVNISELKKVVEIYM